MLFITRLINYKTSALFRTPIYIHSQKDFYSKLKKSVVNYARFGQRERERALTKNTEKYKYYNAVISNQNQLRVLDKTTNSM